MKMLKSYYKITTEGENITTTVAETTAFVLFHA